MNDWGIRLGPGSNSVLIVEAQWETLGQFLSHSPSYLRELLLKKMAEKIIYHLELLKKRHDVNLTDQIKMHIEIVK